MSFASRLPDANAYGCPEAPDKAFRPSTSSGIWVASRISGLVAACLILSAVGSAALATPIDGGAVGVAEPVTLALAPVGTEPLPVASPIQLARHWLQGGGGSLGLPRVSGMPWSSGAGCHASEFDTWRGRPSDIYTWWSPRNTWSNLVSSMGWYRKYASMPGRLSIGLPMLTQEVVGRFDLCNSGAFDVHFTEMGRRLQNSGLSHAVIRLGWEMNHRSFPWSVPGDKKDAYKTCFQRQVTLLRSQAPNLLIDWNPKKGMDFNYDIRDIYPGNAHVDIIGVDYYDGWATMNNEAEWNTQHNALKFGGPYGLATWLAFAKSKGKKLSVPEWGVCRGCNDPNQVDNPFYIRKMNEFFQENVDDLAYETYFNCKTKYNGASFQLYPATENPMSSAEYNLYW